MDKRYLVNILLVLIPIFSSCSSIENKEDNSAQIDPITEEQSEIYTTKLLSEGFQFCPDTYLEIHIDQVHEMAQFNFINHVSSIGELNLKTSGEGKSSLKGKGVIPLSGEGWAGVCQFKSSGSFSFDLVARLFPGEDESPNLIIAGQSENSLTTKPPCGDFGMMPIEKTIFFVIPYRDGESYEWEWKSYTAGVSGTSKWILHIPCK